MKRLTLDDVRGVLPELDELRPVLDLLITGSTADPARAWAGSGELGTLGARLVAGSSVAEAAQALAAETHRRSLAVYGLVGEALRALERGDRSGAARSFLEAAELEEGWERPARAEAWAEAAWRVVGETREHATRALTLRRWGRAAWRLGALGRAREHYAEAFEVASLTDDPEGAAEAAIGAGNVLEQQGRWAEAEAWYHKALDVLDASGSTGPERWHALLDIHIVLRSSGAVDESVTWLERAEEAATIADDPAAPAFLDNARAQLAMARRDFALGEELFRRALTAARGARARVTILLNLGEALLALGRLLDAAETARDAEAEALAAGLGTKLPEVYRLLGRVATARGNPDAFVLFERSLELVRETGLPSLEEAITLQAYADSDRARGENESAAELIAAARERLAELGIEHLRDPWTDAYGSAPGAPFRSRNESEGR